MLAVKVLPDRMPVARRLKKHARHFASAHPALPLPEIDVQGHQRAIHSRVVLEPGTACVVICGRSEIEHLLVAPIAPPCRNVEIFLLLSSVRGRSRGPQRKSVSLTVTKGRVHSLKVTVYFEDPQAVFSSTGRIMTRRTDGRNRFALRILMNSLVHYSLFGVAVSCATCMPTRRATRTTTKNCPSIASA
jgi:hypothetical protein